MLRNWFSHPAVGASAVLTAAATIACMYFIMITSVNFTEQQRGPVSCVCCGISCRILSASQFEPLRHACACTPQAFPVEHGAFQNQIQLPFQVVHAVGEDLPPTQSKPRQLQPVSQPASSPRLSRFHSNPKCLRSHSWADICTYDTLCWNGAQYYMFAPDGDDSITASLRLRKASADLVREQFWP